MTTSTNIDRVRRIREMFLDPATESASEAIQDWTQGRVRISLEDVFEVPLDEISSKIDLGDQQFTMVELEITGAAHGRLLLVFDEPNGRALAKLVSNRPSTPGSPWTPLELSVLCETGNILASAYLNALSRLTSLSVLPSPPTLSEDFEAGVLEQAVLAQAMNSDRILLSQTRFFSAEGELRWHVFFVPDPDLIEIIDEAISEREDT